MNKLTSDQRAEVARIAAADARFMADCAAALAKWHEAKAGEADD